MFLFIDYGVFPIKTLSCHSEEGYALPDHQFQMLSVVAYYQTLSVLIKV